MRILVAALLCTLIPLSVLAQLDNFKTKRFIPKASGQYDTVGQERATKLALESAGLLEREIDASTYILGPNDIVTVSVWASESIHLDLMVTPEGNLIIPRAGAMSVKGLTLDSARKLIKLEVAKVYRSASSNVSLKKLRQFKVYVLGAVRIPSVITATAADRVFDVIERAGGIVDTGSVRGITVVREGSTSPLVVDLQRYLSFGDKSANPTVLGGDRVIVPLRTFKNTISISGEVAREGSFDYLPGDSLSTLIRMAGGFLPSAILDSVHVVRSNEAGTGLDVYSVNMRSWPTAIYSTIPLPGDMALRSGDRVYVRAVPKFNDREQVIVAGEVLYPGKYAITPTQTRLTEVIERAGMFTENASVEDALIIRTSEMNVIDKEYERLSRLVPSEMSSNELQYYRTKSREVKGVMSVDFAELFIKKNMVNNPVLRDGDSIYVPKRSLYVNVTGSVRNPGRIVYQKGLNYLQYIALAGGYSFRADKSATLVIKPKGDQFPAESENYTIEPGDNVLILDEPETKFIDVFTKALTITAQIFTIFGIIFTIVRLK
ncbi:MAG: SLBB domain-containing protein [Bacteroidetes bacterium]|nr:SLBB domain-containing protein [Bacteroidota bacterium]